MTHNNHFVRAINTTLNISKFLYVQDNSHTNGQIVSVGDCNNYITKVSY